MIDLAYAAIIVRDLNNTIAYWNQSAVETYGWSAEEARGKVTDTLLQTKFPISVEELNSILFTSGRWHGELRHVRRDGAEIVVESRQAVVRNEGGEPTAILEVNRDITEHMWAEMKLQESEERYRALVEGIKDYAIFMLDTEGRVASWNAGAERIKGYRAEEIIGEHFSCFYPAEDVERGKPEIALNLAAEEGRYEDEGWRVRKDGTRFFASVVISALIDERGCLRGFSKVTRDVTERKRIEEVLRKTEEQLRQSQKLEAVGQLAGGIAHDFNNLLTAILGQSEMLLRQIKAEPLRQKVEGIKKAGERAALLTYQLLAFSRKQILQPQVLNLNAVVFEMDKILQRLIEENIQITNCGMEAETQKHIFEPFFTTKKASKGTGVGLSTVYGIVKQSGGNIWVYSEVEKGTTFKIYLPRVKEETDTDTYSANATDLPRGDETILLVEDEESVRMLAREVLEDCGYTVLEAASGAEAIPMCQKHDCPIDLLITDVVMPQMGGAELAKRLTAIRPQMRVLYMSGYTDNAIVHHGVLDAGTNFIQKPFSLNALAQKVRELLDESA